MKDSKCFDCEFANDLKELKLFQRDNHRRIIELEEDNSVLHKLVTAVEVIATNVQHIANTQEEHNERLKSIEKKPALYWQTSVTLVVGGLIGYLFSLL